MVDLLLWPLSCKLGINFWNSERSHWCEGSGCLMWPSPAIASILHLPGCSYALNIVMSLTRGSQ